MNKSFIGLFCLAMAGCTPNTEIEVMPKHAIIAIQACQSVGLPIDNIHIDYTFNPEKYYIITAECTKEISIVLKVPVQTQQKKEV